METKLNIEEMNALQDRAAQDAMAAARSQYLRTPGRLVLETMHEIYERVTGSPYTETDACGHCQLKLITYITQWYDETLAAEKAAKAAEKKAKVEAKKGGAKK